MTGLITGWLLTSQIHTWVWSSPLLFERSSWAFSLAGKQGCVAADQYTENICSKTLSGATLLTHFSLSKVHRSQLQRLKRTTIPDPKNTGCLSANTISSDRPSPAAPRGIFLPLCPCAPATPLDAIEERQTVSVPAQMQLSTQADVMHASVYAHASAVPRTSGARSDAIAPGCEGAGAPRPRGAGPALTPPTAVA